MTDNPTPDEVRKSIVPKSDQLNADDLLMGPITVAITKVRSGDREQPIVVEIEGHQPYKPCKGMRRILVAIYSDESVKWVGHRMTLYCDPDVKWGGVKVGGIRISHLSGLATPRSFMVTIGRGKKQEVTIYPIVDLTDEELQFIGAARKDLATAATLEELKEHGEILKSKSKPVQDALRPDYVKRQKELKAK